MGKIVEGADLFVVPSGVRGRIRRQQPRLQSNQGGRNVRPVAGVESCVDSRLLAIHLLYGESLVGAGEPDLQLRVRPIGLQGVHALHNVERIVEKLLLVGCNTGAALTGRLQTVFPLPTIGPVEMLLDLTNLAGLGFVGTGFVGMTGFAGWR